MVPRARRDGGVRDKPFSRLREKVAAQRPDEGRAQDFEVGGFPSPQPSPQAGEGARRHPPAPVPAPPKSC